jgi:hypothetical protein
MLRYGTVMITLDRKNLPAQLLFLCEIQEECLSPFPQLVCLNGMRRFSEKRQFVVDNERHGRVVGMKTDEDMENICNNI